MNRTIGAKEIDEYAQKYNMPVGKDTPQTVGWFLDMVDKAYEQGRVDAIDECIAILIDDSCVKTCPYEIPNCTKCMKKRLEALKEKKNELP